MSLNFNDCLWLLKWYSRVSAQTEKKNTKTKTKNKKQKTTEITSQGEQLQLFYYDFSCLSYVINLYNWLISKWREAKIY